MAPDGSDSVVLAIAARLARIGQGTQLIVGASAETEGRPNATMIRLLARAHALSRRLQTDDTLSINHLADAEGINASYATRLLRLAWLAPDITQAILSGQHPPALTSDKLIRMGPLPIDWAEQRRVLGFR